jgi:hypothetical protein
MKTVIFSGVIGLSLSAILSSAVAQQVTKDVAVPASVAKSASMHAMHQQDHQHERMNMRKQHIQERRLHMQARLKEALKLGPEQEASWQEFIHATQPKVPNMHHDKEAMALMSVPERMEKRLAMAEHRLAVKRQHLQAFKTFYASLSVDQQRVMERAHMRMQKMRKHMRNRGHQAHRSHYAMQGHQQPAKPAAPVKSNKPMRSVQSVKPSNPE